MLICLSCPWQLVDIIDKVKSYGWDVRFVIMRDASGWRSCARCWPRLAEWCSYLCNIQSWIDQEVKSSRWCWHAKFRAVLTAQSKTDSWWGLQALRTHTNRADLAGAACCSGHWQVWLQFSGPAARGVSCWWEELLIDTTELRRHNLIYIHCIDLHWLILVQEEVNRVLLRITGIKQSSCALCPWWRPGESESIIYIWQLIVKQIRFCYIFILVLFFSVLNHLRMKTNHMSAVHHTHAIFSTTTQNKCGIISIHERHLRITK